VLKRVGTGGTVLTVGSGAAAAAGGRPGDNIVETAQDLNDSGPFAGAFDVLIDAVTPELVDTLTGNRQLTVFAPTDTAFEKLGFTESNADDVPVSVLKYHVAPGRRREKSIVNASKVPTLNGETIEVADELAGNFVATDVEASNGIIHAIGTVLDPAD
jgi:uncharacterized surface protein with fasciclin (FAS1) repeats